LKKLSGPHDGAEAYFDGAGPVSIQVNSVVLAEPGANKSTIYSSQKKLKYRDTAETSNSKVNESINITENSIVQYQNRKLSVSRTNFSGTQHTR